MSSSRSWRRIDSFSVMSFADCVSKSVIISACSFCFCTSETDVDVKDEPRSTEMGSVGFGSFSSSTSMG